MSKGLLSSDECLVYIENNNHLPDVEGYTQIARIIKTFPKNGRTWFDLKLLTNSDGDYISRTNTITLSSEKILSDRTKKNIKVKQFYHLPDFDEVTASKFVIKDNPEKALESTSRSALGSGIYGYYISDPSQIGYMINCSNAYIIQDKEHGESITIASLQTNRYMDRILQYLRGNKISDLENIKNFFLLNDIPNLITLWKIVFYRTGDNITRSQLRNILINYIFEYINDDSMSDTTNGESIQELPINHIMRALGYDGLIAIDPFNNGWDRGCISYNYEQASILKGDTALY